MASMGPVRILRHGTIDHGEQFLMAAERALCNHLLRRALGRGPRDSETADERPHERGRDRSGRRNACNVRRPDRPLLRFTTSIPLVLDIARTQFRFLRSCMARNEVVLGDARLSLEREASSNSMCWRWMRSQAMRFRCIC